MKRLWMVLLLAGLAVAAVWLWTPKDAVRGTSAPAETTVAAVQRASPTTARSTDAPDLQRVTTKRQVDRKQREAYLRRIADSVEKRRAAGSKDEPNDRGDAKDPTTRDQGRQDDPGGPGAIKDKSNGELDGLLTAVNEDLLPLAHECYQAAVERDPTVAGMIDINLEVVGDEDVGGIVESFELGEDNEIQDEQMIECIRETTLSTVFPAPEGTGRQGARLTLGFGPDQPE